MVTKPPRNYKNIIITALVLSPLVLAYLYYSDVKAILQSRKVKAAIVSVCPGASSIKVNKKRVFSSKHIDRYVVSASWLMPDGASLTWIKDRPQVSDDLPDEADTGCLKYWDCSDVSGLLNCIPPPKS